MNRQPRLESILEKLHIPDFMYLSPQPAAESARRVSRQEQQAAATKASGSLLTAQTVELASAASSLATPDPEKARPAVFDPAPISPKDQN